MSSRTYPAEPPGAGRVRTHPSGPSLVEGEKKDGDAVEVKVSVESKDDAATTATTTTTTTQLPSPTRDTSMEALSASGYTIVSVVLVLVVGALVGVLATVSRHLHHRRLPHGPTSFIPHHHHHHHHQQQQQHHHQHHHRHHQHHHRRHHHHYHRHHRHHHHHHHQHRKIDEESPSSRQHRLLPRDHQRHSATPMLSVSAGMEVGSGGHGGHGGLGGGLEGGLASGGGGGGGTGADVMQDAMVAAARDRAIRAGSVRQDLALDLPPRLQLPDGEERPYGAHTTLHLRDPEQESEIYQKCVRPPPNRTVFDSESPPPYRSQSALLDAPDRIVRCHSTGSSLLKVFRKFPTPGTSTPAVIVPRRPTLSSYSESSSNLSNLSSLTVVPCETDENNQHV